MLPLLLSASPLQRKSTPGLLNTNPFEHHQKDTGTSTGTGTDTGTDTGTVHVQQWKLHLASQVSI